MRGICGGFAIALLASSAAFAQPAGGTFAVKHLTPETAQKAVNAALAECRKRGFQVAVAVVDRSGVVQALIRDRFAGPHTPRAAIGKGWTAVSFRTDTTELVKMTQPGQPSAGIRNLPRVVMLGGGVQIQSGGTMVGAIGVSGAPAGDLDEQCAKAGIAAIRDEIEM
ncbi:MAG: GlcG/HbpS family heme-binding protein [Gemmatimonadota bacterium]